MGLHMRQEGFEGWWKERRMGPWMGPSTGSLALNLLDMG